MILATDPVTPQERTAVLVWLLATGAVLTSHEAASVLGLSYRRSCELLCELSRVVPIYRGDDGLWRVCAAKGDAVAGGCAIIVAAQEGEL